LKEGAMHFRTVSDLFSAVRRNAHRLPRDVDLVVGVPRSGILAACAVSLVINRPYTDLQSFINGHDVANYSFRKGLAPNIPGDGGISILLVDDSINRGLGMSVARQKLEAYDGARYLEFLKNAPLLNAPCHKINSIVTSRLEKYRPHTVDWLERHGIQYGNLFMLNLDTLEERRRHNAGAEFKARIYKERKDCMLFIESDIDEAMTIRALSGKCVLALNGMEFFSETGGIALQRKIRRNVGKLLPAKSKAAIKSFLKIP
jgi:hypothetical protein